MSNMSLKKAKHDALETRKPAQFLEAAQDKPVFRPNCDIFEDENEILILADLPGVTQEKVDVQLQGDQLVITGIQEQSSYAEMQILHQGCPAGVFRRTFTLLTDVDEKGITAKMTDGVLRIEIPKLEEVKPKRIKVEAA